MKLKPGDVVKMTAAFKKRIKNPKKGSPDHLKEFGSCHGIVDGPVDYGTQKGPELDVRWQPSGLRYAYAAKDLALVSRAKKPAAKKKRGKGKKRISTKKLQAHIDKHIHPSDIGYPAAQEETKAEETEKPKTDKPERPTPRLQCQKCPWKVSTNPHEIPNGYCAVKHAGLKGTIAEPTEYNLSGGVRVMACHDSPVDQPMPCVGWLHHQLGVGNNIGLRLACMAKKIDGNVQTVGEQHKTFEDTLPDDENCGQEEDSEEPEECKHEWKRDQILGGMYCIKCKGTKKR